MEKQCDCPSPEELERFHTESLEKYGWYIHCVADDPATPTGFNAHTHGLPGEVGTPDLQIVVPISPQNAAGVFHRIVNLIRERAKTTGNKFPACGVTYTDILANNYRVQFGSAMEGSRVVLRVLLPDNLGNISPDLPGAWGAQWKGIMDGRPVDPDFTVYAHGICAVSVCTNLSPEEAEKRLNEELPTGIESKWKLSEDKTFAGGQPHPCPCDKNPETHKHYLFNC